MTFKLRLGFIGNGAIARGAMAALEANGSSGMQVVGILVRSQAGEATDTVPTLQKLFEREPDVIVECAGHSAVHESAEIILKSGISLIVASVGALADSALHNRLLGAITGGARLIIPAGAAGGLDAMAAAKLGGLDNVRYRGRKPPLAWQGSDAENLVDLFGITAPTRFFTGTAREAALRFPRNSNVAATIALAGIGFDLTRVELFADPTIHTNHHEIDFDGPDGQFSVSIGSVPSEGNPRTSRLAAHGIARAVLDIASSM